MFSTVEHTPAWMPLNLTLSLLRGGTTPLPQAADELREQAYAFWHACWIETFREHNGGTFHLPSDSFLLADEIAFIRQDEIPVALCLFNWLDLSRPTDRGLSFFDCVTPKSLTDLASPNASHAMLTRFFTVAPAYRGSAAMPVKQTFLNIIGHRWDASHVPLLLGTARRERGMPNAMVRMGGKVLESNLQTRGIPVDLVAIRREDRVLSAEPTIASAAQALWQGREDFIALGSIR